MEFYFSETLNIDTLSGVHLLQDHIGTSYTVPWDDFGYTITFKIYYVDASNRVQKNIGIIKMLSKDYEDTAEYFRSKGKLVEKKIFLITELLHIKFVVSIGDGIDFYKKIYSLFQEPGQRSYILESLCDAGYFRDNYAEYSEWNGYHGSLMRGSSSKTIFNKGYQVAQGNYLAKQQFEISIRGLGETFEPVRFKFNINNDFSRSNICLLIGKNGVGKTHILRNISEIVTGVTKCDGEMPYFHKLIVVAYSPFENFYTKNELFEKLTATYNRDGLVNKKSATRKRLHVNEYSYIGFKNDEGSFSLTNPLTKSINSIIDILKYDEENKWWMLGKKTKFTLFKEALSLSIDFDSLGLFDDEGNEIKLDLEEFSILDLINEVDVNKGIVFYKNGSMIPLSSGQKIYTYMIPSIIAELDTESLLILDEPELYLHPELEVGLIKMLKYILVESDSIAIIATHSAILTREVSQESVSVLRKIEGVTRSDRPTIETFGESIDTIVAEVFDDQLVSKPYQSDIKSYVSGSEVSIDNIRNKIGDNALAYALSLSTDDTLLIEDV